MEDPSMLLVGGVLLLLVGIGLRLSALTPRPPPGGSPAEIPPAMIETGRPFPNPPGRSRRMTGSILIAFGLLVTLFGGCLTILGNAFSGWGSLGRPLRVRGRTRLGRHKRGAGWHDGTRPSVVGLGLWKRARLGQRWLAAARAEHASIAAFGQLRAQLRSLGAPDPLVQRCRLAAMDEVRHARRCFAIARTYAGIEWTAGDLPAAEAAPIDLPSMAVESVLDGCVGEGIATDFARAGAERASDPVIRDALTMLAADEASHAELAWDIVAFCTSRGGRDVERALADATSSLRASASSGPIDLDRATRHQIVRDRLASVRARLAVS